jgi:hypothetical protein
VIEMFYNFKLPLFAGTLFIVISYMRPGLYRIGIRFRSYECDASEHNMTCEEIRVLVSENKETIC